VVLAVIAAAILAIQTYARRGLEAAIQVGADQIGSQVDGMMYEGGDRQNKVFASGVVLKRESATRGFTNGTANTKVLLGGAVQSTTNSNSQNVGDLDPLTYPPNTSAYSEVIIDVVD